MAFPSFLTEEVVAHQVAKEKATGTRSFPVGSRAGLVP